jgi:hypothetical protein
MAWYLLSASNVRALVSAGELQYGNTQPYIHETPCSNQMVYNNAAFANLYAYIAIKTSFKNVRWNMISETNLFGQKTFIFFFFDDTRHRDYQLTESTKPANCTSVGVLRALTGKTTVQPTERIMWQVEWRGTSIFHRRREKGYYISIIHTQSVDGSAT